MYLLPSSSLKIHFLNTVQYTFFSWQVGKPIMFIGRCDGLVVSVRASKSPVPGSNLRSWPSPQASVGRKQKALFSSLSPSSLLLDGLVTAEGTKLKFSEKIVKHAEEMKRKSMQIKIPREAIR